MVGSPPAAHFQGRTHFIAFPAIDHLEPQHVMSLSSSDWVARMPAATVQTGVDEAAKLTADQHSSSDSSLLGHLVLHKPALSASVML